MDEGWGLSGNGWTGDGCDGQTRTTALSDSATWWNLTVGWTFEPYGNQAPATCELDVYVPNSPDATGTASYSIYGKDANGTPITPPIPVVQLSHRGTWVTLGTFDFPDGIVNLELYNVGRGTDHIVADAARAVCR